MPVILAPLDQAGSLPFQLLPASQGPRPTLSTHPDFLKTQHPGDLTQFRPLSTLFPSIPLPLLTEPGEGAIGQHNPCGREASGRSLRTCRERVGKWKRSVAGRRVFTSLVPALCDFGVLAPSVVIQCFHLGSQGSQFLLSAT